MAASTRPDLLDKALLRPGRVDTHIFCDLPGEEERKHIILHQVGPVFNFLDLSIV